MENAIWNGKHISALEVADIYALEKDVRRASGRKELYCPDPACCGVLRYCHGEIKGAYFAHLSNSQCDYAIFDANDTQELRNLRRKLYESFKLQGYDVQLEVKVLEHHYTHLLFTMPTGQRIAVELGTQQTTVKQIEELTEEYRSCGILVNWIVVGDIAELSVAENKINFLKRYSLNESKNKDFILVDRKTLEVVQCRNDTKAYIYKNQDLRSRIQGQIYTDKASIADLRFEDDQLTIQGFSSGYEHWLSLKAATFEAEKERFDAEEKAREREAQKWQTDVANSSIRMMYMQLGESVSKKFSTPIKQSIVTQNRSSMWKDSSIAITVKPLEDRKAEILSLMNQQEKLAIDSAGIRWIRCEKCGKIATEDQFSKYGGLGHVTLGICYECDSKREL